MIKVEHLYKSFDGVPVLKDINVEYESGKCNMIIGASGPGKETIASEDRHPFPGKCPF